MHRSRAVLWTLALFGVATPACSGGSSAPAPLGGTRSDGGQHDAAAEASSSTGSDSSTSRGASADGGDGAAAYDAAADEGGAAPPGDAGDGGPVSGDGALPGSPTDGGVVEAGPPPTPPICATGTIWTLGTTPLVATGSDDIFGAVTPDELTMAWIEQSSTTVTVVVADRASASDRFGAGVAVPAAAPFAAPTKVALSPDGLRLVLVAADHSVLGGAVRASRSDAFPAPSSSNVEVSGIDTENANSESVWSVDDPVIDAKDTTLFFLQYAYGAVHTLLASTRNDVTVPWPAGVALSTSPPGEIDVTITDAMATGYRHPTGVAADDLTLFYWDDGDGTEKAAWRPTVDAPFDHIEALGAMRSAAPNAACTRLYYSAPTPGGSLGVFVATRP